MKTLITAIVLTFFSLEAFAGCTVSFEGPGSMGIGYGFTGEKAFGKISRILEAKGYEVKSDPASRKTAEYVLDVNTSWGIDCGTGLTWVDYLFFPASFEVKLSVNHGNEIFSRVKYFTFPGIGIKPIVNAKLYRAIRAIPECK